MIKRFYISGPKGTYCELDNGWFADTVNGEAINYWPDLTPDEVLEKLLELEAIDVDNPVCGPSMITDFDKYVGW